MSKQAIFSDNLESLVNIMHFQLEFLWHFLLQILPLNHNHHLPRDLHQVVDCKISSPSEIVLAAFALKQQKMDLLKEH